MKPAVYLYGVPGQYENYLAALESAGARVVLCRDLYRSLDCGGLLLPGGGDIRGPLPGTESFLIDSFARSRRPILGICRGLQALNVHWGGTLRDIPGHQLPRGDLVHPTRAEGLMARLLGKLPPSPAATTRRWTAWPRPYRRCSGPRTAWWRRRSTGSCRCWGSSGTRSARAMACAGRTPPGQRPCLPISLH